MKALWSLIPFQYKLIGAGVLVAAVAGWWQLHNYQERQKGAKAAIEKAEGKTNDAIEKLHTNAEVAAFDFGTCFDADGMRWNFTNSRCERDKTGK